MPALRDLSFQFHPLPCYSERSRARFCLSHRARWARGVERNLQFVLSAKGATAQTAQAENAAKQYATCRQMQTKAPAGPALPQRKYELQKDYYSARKDAREPD